MNLKKYVIFVAVMTLLSFGTLLQNFEVSAGVYHEPNLSDNFDSPGLDAEKWQEIGDTNDKINFYEQAGTLRYENVAGAEEAIVTKDALTVGADVTGYSIQFDFLYKTADWGDWFGFAFDKTTLEKGLPWAKGGYLMGRITSLQVNNPSDSTSIDPNSDNIAAFGEMTPELASIANQNVTFKFVYTKATKQLDMYYDLAGEEADLTTLRNSFTLGSLLDEEDYHFAIIGSGKGLLEVDNMKIDIMKDEETVNYLDTDFESATLPEQLVVLTPESFSFGPAKALKLDNLDPNAKLLTANNFIVDPNVNQSLTLSYDMQLNNLQDNATVGFIYGLSDTSKNLTDIGVTYVYFKNKTVGEGDAAVTTTYVGAVTGDGETVVQSLNEKDLGVNLVGEDPMKVTLRFFAYDVVVMSFNDEQLNFTGGPVSGYFGFTAEGNSTAMIDNFDSTIYKYDDQTNNIDLFNNFNTGYINPNDWEIDNYRDLKPGTEIPLFPTAKGIYVENGKLIYDVAGESAGFFTKQSFSDFEMRFTLSDFNKPVTQANEDGEIDGVEVPLTYYIGVSMGHTSTEENTWNVSTIFFQNRDNAAQLYSLNMNNNEVKILNSELQLNSDDNQGATWEYKIIAQGGTVKVWMKRTTDPQAIFEGEPLATYYNVNHLGRIAIASSAAGSFKIDDLSIVRIDDNLRKPMIEDEIDPETIVVDPIVDPVVDPIIDTDNQPEENNISAWGYVGIIAASLVVGGALGFIGTTKFRK